MTRPLREMERAATALAHGHFDQRVTTASVDEVGRLADAFNHMASEIATSEQHQRDLIANVSHELRTPITGLQATLENLLDGVAQPTTETMAAMHAQTLRLGRLVRDLLDLSRLESGTTILDIEMRSVHAMVSNAVDECRTHHPDFRIAVEVSPPDLVACFDAHRMHQVVVNLLDNAARYTDADALTTVQASAERGRLRIEVADHGPGIAEDERSRVFERFYRADHARDTHSGGAGLGLAIVHWIVEIHGGATVIRANEPTGCRIVVELPLDTRRTR
jgi:two-component system sensor histidine kinase BaeS